MKKKRCEGFDHACENEARFTVRSTSYRGEWSACESCAREELLFAFGEVYGANGERVHACVWDGPEHADHLVCAGASAPGAASLAEKIDATMRSKRHDDCDCMSCLPHTY